MQYLKHRSRKTKRKIPVSLLLVLGLVYLIFTESEFLIVKTVEIEGATSFVNLTDIKELSSTRVMGKNIMSVNITGLRTSLLETFQGAKDILIARKPPSTIKIFVIERTPLAVISNNKNEYQYLVDEDGYVLGQVKPGTTNLPEVRYKHEIAVGFFLNSESVSAYFEVLKALDSEKLFASSMSVQSDYLTLFVKDGIEVLIGSNKNITDTVSTLSSLLDQLLAEGKNVKRVDLRYDKVIVSYR